MWEREGQELLRLKGGGHFLLPLTLKSHAGGPAPPAPTLLRIMVVLLHTKRVAERLYMLHDYH